MLNLPGADCADRVSSDHLPKMPQVIAPPERQVQLMKWVAGPADHDVQLEICLSTILHPF